MKNILTIIVLLMLVSCDEETKDSNELIIPTEEVILEPDKDNILGRWQLLGENSNTISNPENRENFELFQDSTINWYGDFYWGNHSFYDITQGAGHYRLYPVNKLLTLSCEGEILTSSGNLVERSQYITGRIDYYSNFKMDLIQTHTINNNGNVSKYVDTFHFRKIYEY